MEIIMGRTYRPSCRGPFRHLERLPTSNLRTGYAPTGSLQPQSWLPPWQIVARGIGGSRTCCEWVRAVSVWGCAVQRERPPRVTTHHMAALAIQASRPQPQPRRVATQTKASYRALLHRVRTDGELHRHKYDLSKMYCKRKTTRHN